MDKVSVYAIKGGRLEPVISGMVGKEAYLSEIGKLSGIVFDGESLISDAIAPSNVGYGDGMSVIISDFLTDADYETVTDSPPPLFPDEPPACERCGACVAACPGLCTEGEREGCLSALTQKKGILTPDEAEAIRKNRLVWGCDVCQLVCPHNIRVIREGRDTPIPYFRDHRLIHVDTPALDAMSDEEFASRAYAWRGRAVIRRNAELTVDR